ncbi:MAG TPA: M28 family peptidase, partial [Chitinophagaceae bacterium]|nr:M28 family peptidase [Chitinophagaceae bacterium]
MKRIVAIILLGFPVFLIAQKKTKTIKAIEKLSSSITASDLKKHLYIIASAEMEGRDTPSPGLEKAGSYIEDHFKLFGLKPGNGDSYRQYYPLYRDSVTQSSIKINGTNFELLKDYFPGNNYTAEIPFSEVVYAGYGITDANVDAYKDLEVRGKAVIILEGSPADYKPTQQGFQNPAGTNSKINAASKNGAAAVLIVSKNFPRTAGSQQSRWSMNRYPASVNPVSFFISEKMAASIMGEDGKGIFNKIKENKEFAKIYKADLDLAYSKTTITTNVSNVLGLVEGTDKKDEYVIITAHYDHVGKRNDTTIYYGADDDGSGTVSVLELAEAFAKAKAAGRGPRRSILFMTVSGEEHGLWGSEYYANNPVYPLYKTT